MSKVEKRIVRVGKIEFGNGAPCIIAGPCSVESEEQIFYMAKTLSNLGVSMLRGGCFKPRTSPYSFQGLGVEGLKYLAAAGKDYSIPVVSEFMSIEQLLEYHHMVDLVQIGSRNMYNYPLLKAAGSIDKPVLLKRGFSATYEEWHMAAEYIISSGNKDVILAERGIRSFGVETRNTFDITAIPYMKQKTGLPVIADPSHALGLREYVGALSLGALAAGADGLMIEVHPNPENALSDGRQSLYIDDFKRLMSKCENLVGSLNE